jgi:hypothetical protein
MSHRRLALPLALAFGLAVASSSAVLAATVSNQYLITGYEYYATSTQGRFAGTATGDTGDSATWRAVVDHTPLTTTATITGGYADLATSRLVLVHGTFVGGTLTLISQQDGCGTQTYNVVGTLGDVTTSDGRGFGKAEFDATLTHYRTWAFGSCITYSARVSGVIELR